MTIVNHGLMINTEFPIYSRWLENEKYILSLKKKLIKNWVENIGKLKQLMNFIK